MGKHGFTVWCCCIIILMLMLVSTSTEVESIEVESDACDEHLENHFSTLTYDLTKGLKCYPKFLKRLRNQVEAPTMVCGLKSTRAKAVEGKEYVLLNLKISNTQWVTLGVDSKNLYVWAYQDNVKYDGKYRASFLKEASTEVIQNLFPEATKRITAIPANYDRLEKSADVTRRQLALGIPNLEHAIRSVYGKSESELQGTIEAKFFLIAIQMVAEAARFKFMEQAIVEGDASPKTKQKMVEFQNDWQEISKSFHKAEDAKPKCIVSLRPFKWAAHCTTM